jgi:hypothetical protein
MPKVSISAVSVNHDTSRYAELMLRSLVAHQPERDRIGITVYDNASTDDTAPLRAFASANGVRFLPSPLARPSKNNSHGDILAHHVRAVPDCTHYLFLDADVVFLDPSPISRMLSDLEADPEAFAVGARISFDGVHEIPSSVREENPDICDARLHPCCALVANSPLFRSVVEDVGLGGYTRHHAERDEYLDTFKLMTRAMRLHGRRHRVGGPLVLHFFGVSYEGSPEVAANKAAKRDDLLARLTVGPARA